MYTVKTNAHFDSAHFLSRYDGKCSNIHGHRWEIEVEVGSKKLSIEPKTKGMVIDFGTLKDDLNSLADKLDHALIIEQGSLKPATMEALKDEGFKILAMPFRPTAEHFAKFIYEEMIKKGYKVVRATVYETPTNCASYSED